VRKDVKTGLFVGLVVSLAVAGALLTRENLGMSNADPVLTREAVNADNGRSGSDAGPAGSSPQPSTMPAQPAALPASPKTSSPSAGDNSSLPTPAKATRFYIVRDNDTLSSISKKYYGTSASAMKIYEANKAVVPNPNRLKIGTKLTIPD
jgi:nucleoid-associated protein YgaU